MSWMSKKKCQALRRKRITDLEIARIIGDPGYMVPKMPFPSLIDALCPTKLNSAYGIKGESVWRYEIIYINEFLTKRFLERQ